MLIDAEKPLEKVKWATLLKGTEYSAQATAIGVAVSSYRTWGDLQNLPARGNVAGHNVFSLLATINEKLADHFTEKPVEAAEEKPKPRRSTSGRSRSNKEND